jgi:hypothetical protein
MPAGIPGTVNRVEDATIEGGFLNASYPPTVFGIPMKIVSGKYLPIAATDVIATVMVNGGFLVRPYPTQRTTNEALGTSTPDTTQIASIMKRGYIMVKVNASLPSAVPTKGGVVYCREDDHGASEYLIGGIESDADDGKCEAIPGCYFTGTMDSDGNCETSLQHLKEVRINADLRKSDIDSTGNS